MNNPPIIYGRNTVTGEITQITTVGNVLLYNDGSLNDLNDVVITSPATNNFLRYNGTNWINAAREYITINMYGTSATTVFSSNTQKAIMAGIASYWQAPIPNPASNTNGNMTASTSPLSSVFETATGFITLNSAKRYMVTATINEGGINYSASTLTELSIYNASSGVPVAFSPNLNNFGRIDIDFTGMGVSTAGVVSGVTKIAVMFRLVTGQGIGVNPTDTCITVTIFEL